MKIPRIKMNEFKLHRSFQSRTRPFIGDQGLIVTEELPDAEGTDTCRVFAEAGGVDSITAISSDIPRWTLRTGDWPSACTADASWVRYGSIGRRVSTSCTRRWS